MVVVVAMFAFRMRAYAAAHFDFAEHMTITWADAHGILQSEYTGGEDGRAYPVTVHGEIRSEGESLEEAEPRLASTIGNVLPAIALASNAAIARPLAVAAYGVDLTTPQPFVGYETPASTEWFPPGNRRIDVEATVALMTAIGTHGQTELTDLLQRAIETYRQALAHWIPEEHLLAGAFLFISAETLGRFLIESRAAARGITPKNLARLEGVSGEKQLRAQYLRDDVFDGDTAALEAMQEASNGFEHGYLSVDDVRGLLQTVLARSMGHVRRALIEASGVPSPMKQRLLAPKYEEPRGLVPAIRFVRGELSRQDADLPPPEMSSGAIDVSIEVQQTNAVPKADGTVDTTWSTNVTVERLPENTTLTVQGYGLRAANLKLVTDPQEDINSADAKDGEAEQKDEGGS